MDPKSSHYRKLRKLEKQTKPTKSRNQKMKHKLTLIIGAALALPALLQAATVNVGTVASSSTTGQYLTSTGALNTTGFVRVGFFNKTFAELQTTISGWSGSTTALAAYESLNNSFTAIGTVINPAASGTLGGTTTGLYTAAGANWNFSSGGAVSGTANLVDLALAPQGSQIYVWAFNNTDLSFVSAAAPTQWALVTDRNATGGTWTLPGSGALSTLLSAVSSQSDVLLGTDSGNNVLMANVIPEPSSASLLALGVAGLVALRARRKS
jgi:hypothetical protein